MKLLDDMLKEIVNDVPNEKGVRLQKKTIVIDYEGKPFTVTVERGDLLNK